MLPTIQQDVWTLADEDDWRRALALLERLPSRATFSAEFDQQVYFIALHGTTQHGLFEAVKFILRGALGHAFFPSPPELRQQHDKCMEPFERERDRIAHREQMERERREFGPVAEPSPEAKARVSAIYAEFCKGYEKAAAEDTLKLDPELVAQIPDNPRSPARQRMGNAA